MSIYINNSTRDDVAPLTVKEQVWIARLDEVLNTCPTTRLALVTIGDRWVHVIDNGITKKYDIELHDGKADGNGVVLANVDGKVQIHGVSG
jgi:hypothetical protein